MKRLLFIFSGATVAGAIGYFLIGWAARWYGAHYIKNDEDISLVFLSALAALVVCILVGGVGGHALFKRRTNR